MNLFKTLIITVPMLCLLGCSIKPQPLTLKEIHRILAKDRKEIEKKQIPVDRAISLHEAMARTIASNITYRVQLMERAVAKGQMEIGKYDLLPDLSANLQAKSRSSYRASVSKSIKTNLISLEASTSEDRTRYISDMSFSWNVMDFGISYYQAKQNADMALISRELHRKALHDLISSVRSSFWRAVAAQELQSEIESILKDAKVSLKNARQVELERLKPPLEILHYQKSLMDIINQMEILYDELERSKDELHDLMNLPKNTKLRLKVPYTNNLQMPRINFSLEVMEKLALTLRPELREEIYRSRINYVDTKKEMLRLLPNLTLQGSYNYDSNSFSTYNNWSDISGKLATNIVDLFSTHSRKNLSKAKMLLTNNKRMALQLTILSQVNLSADQYRTTILHLERAKELRRIEQAILKLITINAKNDSEIELERIRTSAAEINSRLQEFQTYAEAQNAVSRILISVGIDPVDIDYNYSSLEELAGRIKQKMGKWEIARIKKMLSYEEPRDILKKMKKK